MTAVRLGSLRSFSFVRSLIGDENTTVTGIVSDSRRVTPGDVFAVIAGGSVDGAKFISQAIAAGAVALLTERELDAEVPVLVVDQVRARLGAIAHRIYGDPTRPLHTVAITGTNGKTTVTHLIEQVLKASGLRPAIMGTIALRGPAYERTADLTTPEADVIARFAREQLDAGATHLLLEASSHALDQDRLSGVAVEIAGFTNLTQDHLDYHGDMAAYGEAKQRLFTGFVPRTSVIVVDQPFGKQLAELAEGKVLRVSSQVDAIAEFKVLSYHSTRSGIVARVQGPGGEIELNSPLFGAHNLENLLVTLAVTLSLGLSVPQICEALETAAGAPGRMERVASQEDVMVLVDYAHTPNALERALAAVRPLTSGRLFVVCGCGGDRDRTKRAPMARAAVKGADVAVLTSDNPRTEEPLIILAQMEEGARKVGARIDASQLAHATAGYTVIADRAEAIRNTILAARPGDTVLLAGKGHETYQIIGRDKRPFDDRQEAARALTARGAV